LDFKGRSFDHHQIITLNKVKMHQQNKLLYVHSNSRIKTRIKSRIKMHRQHGKNGKNCKLKIGKNGKHTKGHLLYPRN